VLILPPGHAQTLAAPRRFRTRDKWIVGSVLGLVAAFLIGLVISIATSGGTSANGCIDVTLPYVTGGTELKACGTNARSICVSLGQTGSYKGEAARAIKPECRKAGLPVS
jgi:hypothetical protein